MPLLEQNEMARSYERLMQETINMSANYQMERARAFREFKHAFGANSVSFLLNEMKSRPNMAALLLLQQITGENPVPANISGNVGEAAKAWIKWGLRNKGRL